MAGVKLRLMQPNLPQDAKFNGSNGPAILERYLELSDRATSPTTPGLQGVTHLIWPESAFPFLLGRTPGALSRIDAGGEPSPNGNTVSIEDELVRQADTKRQFDLSLSVYQSGLSLLRTSLGRR